MQTKPVHEATDDKMPAEKALADFLRTHGECCLVPGMADPLASAIAEKFPLAPMVAVAEPGARILIAMHRDDLTAVTLDRLQQMVTGRFPGHEVSIMGGVSAIVVANPEEKH